MYDGFDPGDEGLRETLTSTGNGYLCMRGTAEWEDAGDTHYPGTYAHGVYNRETTIMGGRPVPNEDLVNLPNPLVLKLRVEGEEPFSLANVELLAYRHEYDIRNAVVLRRLRFRDRAAATSLISRRFVSMNRMHQAGVAWDLVPENWSGRLEIVSAIDGRVTNRGVAPLPAARGSPSRSTGAAHLRRRHHRPEGAHAPVADRDRRRRTDAVLPHRQEIPVTRATYQTEDYIQQVLAFDVRQGEPVRVEKMVAIFTSRDRGITEPLHNAARSVDRYRTSTRRCGATRAWEELWDVCDVQVPTSRARSSCCGCTSHTFSQACSRLTAHHDAA